MALLRVLGRASSTREMTACRGGSRLRAAARPGTHSYSPTGLPKELWPQTHRHAGKAGQPHGIKCLLECISLLTPFISSMDCFPGLRASWGSMVLRGAGRVVAQERRGRGGMAAHSAPITQAPEVAVQQTRAHSHAHVCTTTGHAGARQVSGLGPTAGPVCHPHSLQPSHS